MSGSLQCSYTDLILNPRNATFLCQAGVKVCGDTEDLIDFYSWYWCDLGNSPWLFGLTCVVVIFLVFNYTSIVVDEYVAEGIQEISDKLGLSESLAAVTLIAFANGAGDVITALLAGSEPGGVAYNIGALYGAGLFVCSLVVAICVLQSKDDLALDKMVIFRDVGFYLLATFITLLFAYFGAITVISAITYLIIYVLLVMAVLYTDKAKQAEEEKRQKLLKSAKSKLVGKVWKGTIEQLKKKKEAEERQNRGGEEEEDRLLDEENQKSTKKQAINKRFKRVVRAAYQNAAMLKFFREKRELKKKAHHEKIEEKTLKEMIFDVIDFPFQILLKLTCVPVNEEEYSKTKCCIFAVPGMIFYYLTIFQTVDLSILYYPLPVGIVLLIIFLVALPDDGTMPSWGIVLSILGVVSGLMWSYLLIGTLIDLLGVIGVVLNLSTTFLGLTILAIGNALPDALTTVALAKNGLATMAISGGVAGQLFGLLIGFGLSMLKVTLTKGPQVFNLFDMSKIHQNILDILVIGSAVVVLGGTYIYGVITNLMIGQVTLKKGFGIFLLVVYAVFFITACVLVFA